MSQLKPRSEKPPNPRKELREHALGIVRICPYVSATALALFFGFLIFLPIALTSCITAIILGAINFPILWFSWYKANGYLSALLIVVQIAILNPGYNFPSEEHPFTHFIAFMLLYIAAQTLLIFLFRTKIRASLTHTETTEDIAPDKR